MATELITGNDEKARLRGPIILLVLMITCIHGPIGLVYLASYLDGVNNDVRWRSIAMFGCLLLLICACLTGVMCLKKLLDELRRWYRSKIHSIRRIVLLHMALAVLPTWGLFHPPNVKIFLRGFEQWTQKNVDVSAIREWLESTPVYGPGKFYGLTDKLPDNLPKVVMKLSPQHIYFPELSDPWDKCVVFEWGGALPGHWGVVIGSPDMKIPPQDNVQPEIREREVRRIVQPGVYLYYGED